MSKLTVVNSRYTAYEGKEFENLGDYLEYQAIIKDTCKHPLLIHLPSENDTHVYDNWYCKNCGALIENHITRKSWAT